MAKIVVSFIFICLIFQLSSTPTINVFGDSHGSFMFSNERNKIPRNELSVFTHTTGYKSQHISCKINWFGSKTMHSVGRDGLRALNLKHLGVSDGDVAIFVFGEVDARCHIGKQNILQGRDLHEVIDTLASNFIRTIHENRLLFEKLYCVVVSVMPPTDGAFNSVLPYFGSLRDRVVITQQLNKRLQELCEQHSFHFFDLYPLYATPDGSLDDEKSDKVVHVNPAYNDQIKQALIDQLAQKYYLFDIT